MNVLIIEDDLDFRNKLREEFEDLGFKVFYCNEFDELEGIEAKCTHAVVDLRLKDKSGLDFIPKVRSKYPEIKMTMLTAYGSVATSVKAIKLGADNYIMKPCTFNELMLALDCGNLDENEDSQNIPGLYQKEREYIEYVLALHDGNISKAADSLGIRRQSLQRKLKKYPS